MVYTLIDHRNAAKNVQHFAVKPLASGWWFHLSFEHFDVFSIVEWNIVVYLLINVNNLINKNSQSTIFRSGTLIGHLNSKTPHFQNEAKCTTLLAKMSFICMRMKNANNSFSPLRLCT